MIPKETPAQSAYWGLQALACDACEDSLNHLVLAVSDGDWGEVETLRNEIVNTIKEICTAALPHMRGSKNEHGN